jgi:NADPH-dependent 2,4-dienoyl-CoA reductase/sulfur reductase-like enzyme
VRGIPESVDLLVVGGGPAGIAAAVAASAEGREVLLVDRRPRLGGNVWFQEAGRPPDRRAQSALNGLSGSSARVATSTEVIDCPQESTLRLRSGDEVADVRYTGLVLATGARERFLPFPGWTLPHVTGAGALQLLAKGGLRLEGRSVVVAGSGPVLLAAAAYLRENGADVRLVAEQASRSQIGRLALGLLTVPSRAREALGLFRQLRGVPYLLGCWPVRAEGSERVERVVLRRGAREWTVDCDFLACGFDLVGNTDLAELVGCSVRRGFVSVDPFQRTSAAGVYAAGEPVGIGGMDLAQIEGEIAGLSFAGRSDEARRRFSRRNRLARLRPAFARAFALKPRLRMLATPETVVCRCEDLPARTLASFRSGREARLLSRCGMGRCQGRVCGPATEFLMGWTPQSPRPPLVPTAVSAWSRLSGREEP